MSTADSVFYQLFNPTDAFSLWGIRDPEHPYPVVPYTLTPHFWVPFQFREQKPLALGQFTTDVSCNRQLPKTGYENQLLRNSHTLVPINHLAPAQKQTGRLSPEHLYGFNASCWELRILSLLRFKNTEFRGSLESRHYNSYRLKENLQIYPKLWHNAFLYHWPCRSLSLQPPHGDLSLYRYSEPWAVGPFLCPHARQ